MLKKITGVILTMSVLFSVFLTTPAYAATKKVATGLKEVTGVTLTRKEYQEEDPIDEDVTFIDPDAYVFNFVFDKHGKELYWFARIDMYNMDQVQDIFVIDVATKKVVDTLRLVREEYGFNIVSSANGRYASVLTENGPAIYDIKTKKLIPTDYTYNYMCECISDLALVSISDGSGRSYSSDDNGKSLEILDLNTGKIVTNNYGDVVRLDTIHYFDTFIYSNEVIGLSIFTSDRKATIIYNKGLSQNEYKEVDPFNTSFSIDDKYIYEELCYPYWRTKLYDLKTNELLATSSNSVIYNKDTNTFIVSTPVDGNLNFKTYLYNTEGKKLGEFDRNVNQKFIDINTDNSLHKPIIVYGDYSVDVYNPIIKMYEIIYS